jgi:hypothetical protein
VYPKRFGQQWFLLNSRWLILPQDGNFGLLRKMLIFDFTEVVGGDVK